MCRYQWVHHHYLYVILDIISIHYTVIVSNVFRYIEWVSHYNKYNTGQYLAYINEDFDSVRNCMGIKEERRLNHTHKGLTPRESKSTAVYYQGCRVRTLLPPRRILVTDDGGSFFSCGSSLSHPIIRTFSIYPDLRPSFSSSLSASRLSKFNFAWPLPPNLRPFQAFVWWTPPSMPSRNGGSQNLNVSECRDVVN